MSILMGISEMELFNHASLRGAVKAWNKCGSSLNLNTIYTPLQLISNIQKFLYFLQSHAYSR